VKDEAGHLLMHKNVAVGLRKIARKVMAGDRITADDAMKLYSGADLGWLGMLASVVRRRFNGEYVYFNRNFHIEPTNICTNTCRFCSFRRRKEQNDAWELNMEDVKTIAASYRNKNVTEVHIVGGVHPDRDVHYYADMVREVKKVLPHVHVKAFTAVEIDCMAKKAGVTVEEGFRILRVAGLDSMPGGGAEIFDEALRAKICPDKTSSDMWLTIHEKAHQTGIPTNCTMLYGLFEEYEHRIDHMNRLRELQDRTGGFNVFIPLKFRHGNNAFSHVKESSLIEDLKTFAIARIFLDNIPHLKAYWPMLGKETAQLSLAFGVDDLDGTIDDSTKIYSMAGSDEQNPIATTDELVELIRESGFVPVERDTLFRILKKYD